MLRDYQQRTIDDLYAWFESGNQGHPCLVLPTGSGKSHIVAALTKDALHKWPQTRVLMLTHVKELIRQNAEKMRQHWPNAPMGIYSAGLRAKTLGEPITFAGIQSVRRKAALIGHIDLCIVDECFTGETMIATPSGHKRIDNVRCGDVVYNQSGCGIVEAVSQNQASNLYEVNLSDGSTIKCTGNHKFFTDTGWKEAKALENDTYLYSIEDMSLLWDEVHTLDQERWRRESHLRHAGGCLGQAEFLLRQVCKEITPNSIDGTGKEENQRTIEGNKAQTYKTWRERAITTLTATGTSSCFRGRVGSGVVCADKKRPQERRVSKSLQNRHCEQRTDDCNRTGRREPFEHGEARAGQQKGCSLGSIRVESVSPIKSESNGTVFNLQVSGHPSYFAGGVAVHNCHLISHKNEGGYRTLISDLLEINPNMRVVGLTATPFRLGHGLITDAPALFSDLIEPVTIEELIYKGHLAPLRSKVTDVKLSTEGVHKRGGEFIESELQAAVDTHETNADVVRSVLTHAGPRKSWLVFCVGVDHAHNIRDELLQSGITAATVTGDTPANERDQILTAFKAGQIQAVTNANVLTTGFDHPDLDLIAMLRPTMSASLYVQMAGRGMRVKSHTDHCLVLDYAGVVQTHGPITNVEPGRKAGEGGEMPVKVCGECDELVHISAKICPACGAPFPEPEPKPVTLHNLDIMGIEATEMTVSDWNWQIHVGRSSGKEMLKVTYYGDLSDPPITEYFTIFYDGPAGNKARKTVEKIRVAVGVDSPSDLKDAQHPITIKYRKDGKFHRVLERKWEHGAVR